MDVTLRSSLGGERIAANDVIGAVRDLRQIVNGRPVRAAGASHSLLKSGCRKKALDLRGDLCSIDEHGVRLENLDHGLYGGLTASGSEDGGRCGMEKLLAGLILPENAHCGYPVQLPRELNCCWSLLLSYHPHLGEGKLFLAHRWAGVSMLFALLAGHDDQSAARASELWPEKMDRLRDWTGLDFRVYWFVAAAYRFLRRRKRDILIYGI